MKKSMLFIMMTCSLSAQADWHKAYETDNSGNVVYGELCALKTYIENGYDVKVIISGNGPHNNYWSSSISPSAISFKDNYIYARATPGIAEKFNEQGLIDFQNTNNAADMYKAESIIDSSGRVVTQRYSLNGDRLKEKTIFTAATKWFVDTASPLLSKNACQ
ncbi:MULTISPECIES: hypothetical protein [Aeromonas]|uniref:hypothetical protein n=1 Tax=Aeromonas TaxID=642 RepID=UPI001C2149AB|nr:hypothetical protein [Aeromonas sp. FDAARGOS 1403]QXA14803.1 hypothetical protein I6L33_17415 [Aeromonas sp. FDAARGOS 1403]